MAINIANFFDADRRSAKAGETMSIGMVVKVRTTAETALYTGSERELMKLANGDSALMVAGGVGVVYKVSANADQVDTTTLTAAQLANMGDRRVTIASGDQVVEVRRGAIIEYAMSDLDASLDTARGGALPVAGAALGVVGSLFCATTAGSAITSPVLGKCYAVRGGKILVELVL